MSVPPQERTGTRESTPRLHRGRVRREINIPLAALTAWGAITGAGVGYLLYHESQEKPNITAQQIEDATKDYGLVFESNAAKNFKKGIEQNIPDINAAIGRAEAEDAKKDAKEIAKLTEADNNLKTSLTQEQNNRQGEDKSLSDQIAEEKKTRETEATAVASALKDEEQKRTNAIATAVTETLRKQQIERDAAITTAIAEKLKDVAQMPQIIPAEKTTSNTWILQHPDENGKTQEIALPDGFIPDKSLHLATDIQPLPINKDLNVYQDWEKALNTGRPVGDRLAGYNYDYNDFCNNPAPAFTCTVQADMYAWRTFQGQDITVPGIGELKGGPRKSVVLNILNLDGSVYAWDPENPVMVKHGFTATGRIFDGEKKVDELERNLSGHWGFRQGFGTPEKSYIGITDSPDNATETLMVSVQRKQWGNNPDGTKRYEFQLIRAEMIKLK